MSYKQNLHTHCSYCDGKDTPKEMVEKAISLGFESIGFSSHTPMFYSFASGMSVEETNDYVAEINALKAEYADRIKIFCGWEYDIYTDLDLRPCDYMIGSLHYFKFGDEYVGFDRTKEVSQDIINTYFSGDGMKYAKEYYKNLATLPQYGDFEILGHFDIITKHCENANFFDVESKEYLNYAFEAVEALKGKIPFFEVNTGAIARGYRTTPYPSIPIMKELKRQGFKAIITSDCHDSEMLACNFEQAIEMLKMCGFNEKYILTENGFKAVGLEE